MDECCARALTQGLTADRINAALKRVFASLAPTNAAQQIGLGGSTVYH